MNSKLNGLIKQSKNFEADNIEIQTGAKSHKENITLEEKIIQLEKYDKFLESRIREAEVDSIENSSILTIIDGMKDDNTACKLKLLKKVNNLNNRNKLFQLILLSKTIKNLFESSETDRPEIKMFKDKILEQLENLSKSHDIIMGLTEEINQVSKETITFKLELRENLNEFQKKLNLCAEITDKNTNEYNKENVEKLEKRIEKLNFMRFLISELLICVNSFEKNEETIRLFEKMRNPFSLDDFINPS